MSTFTRESFAQRVTFGTDHARSTVTREVHALGLNRILFVNDRGDSAAELVADIPVVVAWGDVVQHVPKEIADAAVDAAASGRIDGIVAVGGGSATGLGKIVAREMSVPLIAIPTTYAGSEATNVWGITDGSRKTTGTDARVLPRVVVYDASLVRSMPVEFAVSSALNALAHCIDSLWAPRSNPIDAALALEGVRALRESVDAPPRGGAPVVHHESAQYGAYLAATAFSSAGSGMHHKICHVLGGTYDLPHAQTHAVVLPYVLAYNVDGIGGIAGRLAAVLGEDDALDGMLAWFARVGAPTSLRALGLEERDLDEASRLTAAAVPPDNPRPVDAAAMRRLLAAALDGLDPRTMRGSR